MTIYSVCAGDGEDMVVLGEFASVGEAKSFACAQVEKFKQDFGAYIYNHDVLKKTCDFVSETRIYEGDSVWIENDGTDGVVEELNYFFAIDGVVELYLDDNEWEIL
jgi:hypothetical protein